VSNQNDKLIRNGRRQQYSPALRAYWETAYRRCSWTKARCYVGNHYDLGAAAAGISWLQQKNTSGFVRRLYWITSNADFLIAINNPEKMSVLWQKNWSVPILGHRWRHQVLIFLDRTDKDKPLSLKPVAWTVLKRRNVGGDFPKGTRSYITRLVFKKGDPW
jgi:hypothetical protein